MFKDYVFFMLLSFEFINLFLYGCYFMGLIKEIFLHTNVLIYFHMFSFITFTTLPFTYIFKPETHFCVYWDIEPSFIYFSNA